MATPSIQASTLPQKSNNRFSYTPLPVGHIRLLRLCANADPAAQICCQLFNYPISRSTGGTHLYDAVSYVWGDHTKSHTIILAQEGPTADLRVTRNLWDVLRHLRDESLDRVIWVDAVCINQSDDMEKAVQIRRMTKIFSIASRVIVWLEEPGNGGDEALETLRVASEMKSLGRVVAAGEEVKERILRLLNTPWFQRIWVSQSQTRTVEQTRTLAKPWVRCSKKLRQLGKSLSGADPQKLMGLPSVVGSNVSQSFCRHCKAIMLTLSPL